MEKLKDDNTFLMYGWIPKKLKLKGNELIIYSIIYSFSIKSNKGYFEGSTAYLQQWTNTSQRNVINVLKNLIEKDLIILLEDNSKIRKPNKYKINIDILSFLTTEKSSVVDNTTTEKNSVALLKKVQQTTENSSVNKNIYNNINNNIYAQSKIDASNSLSQEDDNSNTKKEADTKVPTSKKDNTASKKKGGYTKTDYIADIEAYTQNQELKDALLDFYQMRKQNKKTISTARTTKRLLSKLDNLSNDDDIKIAIVNKSIDHCWQDVYKLENKEAAGNSQPQEVQPQEDYSQYKVNSINFLG